MIFADKLIQLRKKAAWSQEELAGQMNVSRGSLFLMGRSAVHPGSGKNDSAVKMIRGYHRLFIKR